MKITHLLFCALGTFVLAPRADAQVLYGAIASNSPGELFILNPATGATVQDIGPLNDSLGVNYGITGLAFNPVTGVLYGSTANGSSYGAATKKQLVTINPATARVTVIGPFTAAASGTMTDLAFTAAGQLYGINSNGGANLNSINILTGAATQVGIAGPTFTAGGGLAISLAGVFSGTPTQTQYGTYDPTTGVYTNIGTPALPAGGGAYAALAFDSLGTLFGLNSGPGSPPATHLVTIDPATATVTDIGASVPALDAIAFGPAAVPEPGTMALLFGPVAVGLVRAVRRRKAMTT